MATYANLTGRSINTRNGRPPDQSKQGDTGKVLQVRLKIVRNNQSYSVVNSFPDEYSNSGSAALTEPHFNKQPHGQKPKDEDDASSNYSTESSLVHLLSDSLEVVIQEQDDTSDEENNGNNEEETADGLAEESEEEEDEQFWAEQEQEGESVCGISEKELRRAALAIVNRQAEGREKRRQQSRPKNYVCQVEGCGQACGNRTSLRRHTQTRHLGLKPYRCGWARCRYSNSQRYMVLSHVRTVHFGQPRTLAKRQEIGLPDDGPDPNHFVSVDLRLLKRMNSET